jgi:hypothetical protein
MGRLTLLAALALGGGGWACRERAKAVQSEGALLDLVHQLETQAERITGLQFKHQVAVRLRTRAQLRDYVTHKFDQDLPPPELAGVQAAYKLFGFIPDSLDLRRTMIALLTEQVAGYYDPDSGALFVPNDLSDRFQIRTVAAHELVHALQDQYMPLDSILNQRRHNDRRSAAEAVLEGQATFYQISILMPEQHPETFPDHWFWRQSETTALQQAAMPEFAGAPLWLRESLIFPYLRGADFVGWYVRTHHGHEPYGADMPVSTEQILHPDRYATGDEPVTLAFPARVPDAVRYEDDLGEFEIGLLFAQLMGDLNDDKGSVYAQGWAGDRYQVYGPPSGADALVWYSVWDTPGARDRFVRGLIRAWAGRPAARASGRRSTVEAVTVDGLPGARLVDAPEAWVGWKALPEVHVIR